MLIITKLSEMLENLGNVKSKRLKCDDKCGIHFLQQHKANSTNSGNSPVVAAELTTCEYS